MAGPGFVSWGTEFPDGTGAQYPGPGTFGTHTSDYCVSGGVAEVLGPETLPGTTFPPVSQWDFQGNLLDAQGVDNMTLSAGAEQYTTGPFAGSLAFDVTAATYVEGTNPAPAALRITGPMSYAVWAYITNTIGTFGSTIMSCDGDPVPVTDPNNNTWELTIRTAAGRFRSAWEGPANTFNVLGVTTPAVAFGAWYFFVSTRSGGGAGTVRGRLYINGETVESSDTLSPPTDGSLGVVHFGASRWIPANLQFTGRIAGATVYNRELTQAEAIALYKKGIAPELR
jgi:hypothetical protein